LQEVKSLARVFADVFGDGLRTDEHIVTKYLIFHHRTSRVAREYNLLSTI